MERKTLAELDVIKSDYKAKTETSDSLGEWKHILEKKGIFFKYKKISKDNNFTVAEKSGELLDPLEEEYYKRNIERIAPLSKWEVLDWFN